MNRIKQLIEKYWEVLSYLVFGVLTTVVNYIVYIPVYHFMGLPASVSNVLAWIAAVTFAYLTNKPFVFKSHDWSMKAVVPELISFVSCRVASLVIETAILFVAVDWLRWDGLIWKLITSVLVVVLNYIGSKLFVFRKAK